MSRADETTTHALMAAPASRKDPPTTEISFTDANAMSIKASWMLPTPENIANTSPPFFVKVAVMDFRIARCFAPMVENARIKTLMRVLNTKVAPVQMAGMGTIAKFK